MKIPARNNLLKKSALSTAIALTLIACTGGGIGGLAGIGGSGFISSGSITGFGSVFVNGVEFNTDDAVFDLEGVIGTRAELEVKLSEGMRVKISGSINADGVTGTASKVVFDDQLEGPINSNIEIVDMQNKNFTVLGIKVRINKATTVFADPLLVNFDNIATGNNIQISGFFDANGILKATAIVKKDDFVAGVTEVEVKGTISALTADTFTLSTGSVTRQISAGSAHFSELKNGQFVEVEGTTETPGGTLISASEVDIEDDHPAEGVDVEIEGSITDFDATANTFNIDGIAIDASSAEKTPTTLILENGVRVEVEGEITNGVLLAEEIQLREGNVEMEAVASEVTADSFEMTYHYGTVTITVNNNTYMEDNNDFPFSLAQLASKVNNQFLQVSGIDNGTNGVIATHISVEDFPNPVDSKIQGAGDSDHNVGTVTVLGIRFNADGNTEFEGNGGDDEDDLTHAGFDLLVTPSTIIEIEDDGNDGVADEVEIESP